MTGSGDRVHRAGCRRDLLDHRHVRGLRHDGAPSATNPCFDATGDCFTVHGLRVDPAVAPLGRDVSRKPCRDTSVRTWPIHVGRSFSDVPVPARRLPLRRDGPAPAGSRPAAAGPLYCPETRSRARRWRCSCSVPSTARPTSRRRPRARSSTTSPRTRLPRRSSSVSRRRGSPRAAEPERTTVPNARVTRAQMAVFLLKTEHGSAWTPPAASGDFTDVPVANPFAPWVEALKDEGVTAGCGVNVYCPIGADASAARWRCSSRRPSGSRCTGRSVPLATFELPPSQARLRPA